MNCAQRLLADNGCSGLWRSGERSEEHLCFRSPDHRGNHLCTCGFGWDLLDPDPEMHTTRELLTANEELRGVVAELQRALADCRDERDILSGAIEVLQIAAERLDTGDDEAEEEAFRDGYERAIRRLLLLDLEDLDKQEAT